jgi:DNA-directed RNA polymerase alpha subunit
MSEGKTLDKEMLDLIGAIEIGVAGVRRAVDQLDKLVALVKRNEILGKPVDDLEPSVRLGSYLSSAGIRYVGELVQKTEHDLLRKHHFGPRMLKEVEGLLQEMGLSLGMNLGNWSPPKSRTGEGRP